MFRVFLFLLLFAFFTVPTVFAQTPPPPPPPAPTLNELLGQWQSLIGTAALIAALVNVGKRIGLVQDGYAGWWSLGMNVLGLAALIALGLYAPDADLGRVDEVAGTIATVINLLVGLVVQLGGSVLVHKLLSSMRLPVIGKSFST